MAIIAETSLPAAIGNIDLLLHGYFFVSSARTEVRTVDEPGAEGRWNAALEAEATLSQVLPALAAAIPALPNDDDRGALLDALKKTDWWGKHRALVCQSEALAQVWDGGGCAKWKRVPAAAVRPIASASSTSRERLSTGLPGLANWCAQTGIVLAHGPILAAEDCRWKDAELAAIVRLAGPAAFTKLRIAETIVIFP
ncbi:hypothetical protein [Sphingomonas oligophenolica]|uniref:Uncharacterized protein n=1 Tax=Sphingomonas oligophenolica TaxID=301154 RepID=A0A502CAG2_9SPHN|nr:hypothetical protein [Sphingomonas oligophenolica]TPG09624.1 hypothetical protein EAH84_13585 [Sphingomonas oligophenolica]